MAGQAGGRGRRNSTADDFFELAGRTSSPTTADLARHLGELAQALELEQPEVLQRPRVVACFAAIQGCLEGLGDEIAGLNEQVEALREQLAADKKETNARLKAMLAKIAALERKNQELAEGRELERQERCRASAVFMRTVAAELQCLCIQTAMDWTRKQRTDEDIESFADFEEYVSKQPLGQANKLRLQLEASQRAMGIDADALSALDIIRKGGNQYAHERIDKLPPSEAKERLARAVAAFPMAVYSAELDATVQLPKDVVQRVAALYTAVRRLG